jgi:diketogulonate reductase-like aldo/keto reductase
VRNLGISNCYDVETLRALWEAAEVKPAFVQNRFYLKTNFDEDVRAYCAEKVCMVHARMWRAMRCFLELVRPTITP